MITTDWTPDRTNLLCDLIAEDRTFSQAARIMRLSKNAVIGKFARIRRAYGRQGL